MTETSLVPILDAQFKVLEEEQISQYLRPHEARKIIEASNTPRDHLLFNILWQTGARINEALKLRPMDISQSGISMVTEKKRLSKKKRLLSGAWTDRKVPINKNKIFRRVIPIKPDLYGEIMSYCFHVHTKPDASIFDITSRRAEQICKACVKKASMDYKKVHPHSFRHGFAIHFINSGGSLARLMKILGHAHINTTMIYLKYADMDLKRDIDRIDF